MNQAASRDRGNGDGPSPRRWGRVVFVACLATLLTAKLWKNREAAARDLAGITRIETACDCKVQVYRSRPLGLSLGELEVQTLHLNVNSLTEAQLREIAMLIDHLPGLRVISVEQPFNERNFSLLKELTPTVDVTRFFISSRGHWEGVADGHFLRLSRASGPPG